MTQYEYYIVFPDGETQEISGVLHPSQLVDINGIPLPLPLPTNRMIVYRISGKRTREERGIVSTWYILEQLNAIELLEFV